MASTLVRRIIAPDLSVGELKLPIHTIIGLMQEVIAGRLVVLGSLVFVAEESDAQTIIDLVPATLTLVAVENILHLGEQGFYDVAAVQTIFGIA